MSSPFSTLTVVHMTLAKVDELIEELNTSVDSNHRHQPRQAIDTYRLD